MFQAASICQCQGRIQALRSEITVLTEEVISIDIRWRAGIVTDTDELKREMIVAMMAIKSKQLQLENNESWLGRLELDLLKRRAQEYTRLAAERKEERRWQDQEEREEQQRKEMLAKEALAKERLAKERLEAEERMQREADWEARMNDIRQRTRQYMLPRETVYCKADRSSKASRRC